MHGTTRETWLPPVLGAALVAVGAAILAASGGQAAPGAEPAVTCTWTRLTDGPALAEHALVALPLTERAVVAYGGLGSIPAEEDLSAAATLLALGAGSGGLWVTLPASGTPPDGRFRHAAVLRERALGTELVIFGGEAARAAGGAAAAGGRPSEPAPVVSRTADEPEPALEVRSDTHALPPFGAWRLLPAVDSRPRADHAALYWPARDALLAFGGRSELGPESAVSTTLRLPLEGDTPTWSELLTAGDAPEPRYGHTVVLDHHHGQVILFGGTTDGVSALADTWVMTLGGDVPTWMPLQTAGPTPAGRFQHAAAFLAEPGWMVVLGGTTDGADDLDEVLVLDLTQEPPTWRVLALAGDTPGPRRSAAAAAPGPTELVLHGGLLDEDVLDDAWLLRCAAPPPPTATLPEPSDTPLPTDPATPEGTPSPTETPPGPTATAHEPTVTPSATDEGTPEATPTAEEPTAGPPATEEPTPEDTPEATATVEEPTAAPPATEEPAPDRTVAHLPALYRSTR